MYLHTYIGIVQLRGPIILEVCIRITHHSHEGVCACIMAVDLKITERPDSEIQETAWDSCCCMEGLPCAQEGRV